MLKINILLILLISLKCEIWYSLVNGHNPDEDNGFAGDNKNFLTDFYLCSKRHYRVHFLGDPEDIWSQEYSNCEPVGDGRPIDAFSIDGGEKYAVRLYMSKWLPMVKGYNISDEKEGYAGLFTKRIDAILIYGDEYYRAAYGEKSSNPKKVAERIVNNIFGKGLNNIEYNKEKEFITFPQFNATIQLLNDYEIDLDEDLIKFEMEKGSIINYDIGGLIGNNLNENLRELINFDILEIENYLKNIISNETENGITTIHFLWNEGKVQIDFGVKITHDIENFRGGFRINIYINNLESQLKQIKDIVRLFSRYTDIKSRNKINNIIENLNDVKQLSEISKNIFIYNMMMSRIILLTIIFPSLKI